MMSRNHSTNNAASRSGRRSTFRRFAILLASVGLIAAAIVPLASPLSVAQTGSTRNRDCPDYPTNYDDPRITWTELTPPGGVGQRDMFFLDTQRGWVVGEAGMLLFTIDGGLSWEKGTIPEEPELSMRPFQRVYFADKDNGWAMTGDLVLVRTIDGGVTWTSQSIPQPPDPRVPVTLDLSVVREPGSSTLKAWISGRYIVGTWPDIEERGFLLTSTQELNNPEGHWSPVDETWHTKKTDGAPAPVLRDILFFDSSNGLATSDPATEARNEEQGAIFSTTDAGKTWKLERKNPETALASEQDQRKTGGFDSLWFADRFHGYAKWEKDDYKAKIWSATPDGQGGRQWKEVTTCQTFPTSVAFSSGPNCTAQAPHCNVLAGRNFDEGATQGGAVIVDSPVALSSDGGDTWIPDVGPDNPASNSDWQVGALSYPAPTTAFAINLTVGVGRVFRATITLVEVTAIQPATACPGAVVTIKGSGFTAASTVAFGPIGVPPGDVIFVSPGELKVKVPPRAGQETVDVTVTTPESAPGKGDHLGTSLTNERTKFTYLGGIVDATPLEADPPTVKSVRPNKGKVAGGDVLLIAGNNLTCAQSVVFRGSGGTAKPGVDASVLPNGTVRVKAPPWDGPAVVDLIVKTPGIAGPEIEAIPETASANDYTYVADPPPLPLDGGPVECLECGGGEGGGQGGSGRPLAPPGTPTSSTTLPNQSSITIAPPSPPGGASPGTAASSGPASQPLGEPVSSTSLGLKGSFSPDSASSGAFGQAGQGQVAGARAAQGQAVPGPAAGLREQRVPAPQYHMVATREPASHEAMVAGGGILLAAAACVVLSSGARARAAAAYAGAGIGSRANRAGRSAAAAI